MAPTEQLEYESRVRLRYGVVAFFAGILVVVAQLVSLSGSHPDVSELTLTLISSTQRGTQLIGGSFLSALSIVGLGLTLVFLHRITRPRRPQGSDVVMWIAVAFVAVTAILTPIEAIIFLHKAHQFLHTSYLSYPQADALFTGVVELLEILIELGTLFLAGATVMIILNAMRVGLLNRPVGWIGIVAAVLLFLSLFLSGVAGITYLQPLLQALWLVLTALIFAKRWPGGDFPAWQEGIAAPWKPLTNPNATAARAQRQRGGRQATSTPPPAAPRRRSMFGGGASHPQEIAPPEPPQPRPQPRAGTPKRKRKRR